jgi:tRNA threonylcarbamoyladenosine biosynthesis protein TsaB
VILSIRTDKSSAEIGLFDGQTKVDYIVWEAHRELSVQIHQKIEELLSKNSQSYENLKGIAVFEGPGSFTGLRIGISVANALAYSLDIPVGSARDSDWINQSIKILMNKKGKPIAAPFYGQLPKTTNPRK